MQEHVQKQEQAQEQTQEEASEQAQEQVQEQAQNDAKSHEPKQAKQQELAGHKEAEEHEQAGWHQDQEPDGQDVRRRATRGERSSSQTCLAERKHHEPRERQPQRFGAGTPQVAT